jgi:hypothetical protein
MFRSLEDPTRCCPEVIDLTGPRRCLFFGPYFMLDPGTWRASVELSVCKDAARRALELEFGVDPGAEYTRLPLPTGIDGRLRIELVHRVEVAARAQVRLWLRRAAFHGEVRLHEVVTELLGSADMILPQAAIDAEF